MELNWVIVVLVILAIPVVIAFITLVHYFIKYRSTEMKYALACAGTEYVEKNQTTDLNKERIKNSIYTNYFLDNQGHALDVDQFNQFVVKGSSMMLAGISDGDLIFASKEFDYNKLSSSNVLRNIYVIRREKEKGQRINYKLRRGWKIIPNLSAIEKGNEREYFKGVLSEIIKSPEFSELKKKAMKESVIVPSDEELMEDFFKERLEKYSTKYSSNNQYTEEYNSILISTTLHTDKNTIKFSIHPITSIVGKLDYCYHVADQSKSNAA